MCELQSKKSLIGYASAGKVMFPDDGVENKADFSLVAFWFVDHTPDPTKANIELAKLPVEVSGKATKGDSTVFKMKVPVWTNTRALQEGEELLYHKPAKRVADAVPLPPPPAKRSAPPGKQGKQRK